MSCESSDRDQLVHDSDSVNPSAPPRPVVFPSYRKPLPPIPGPKNPSRPSLFESVRTHSAPAVVEHQSKLHDCSQPEHGPTDTEREKGLATEATRPSASDHLSADGVGKHIHSSLEDDRLRLKLFIPSETQSQGHETPNDRLGSDLASSSSPAYSLPNSAPSSPLDARVLAQMSQTQSRIASWAATPSLFVTSKEDDSPILPLYEGTPSASSDLPSITESPENRSSPEQASPMFPISPWNPPASTSLRSIDHLNSRFSLQGDGCSDIGTVVDALPEYEDTMPETLLSPGTTINEKSSYAASYVHSPLDSPVQQIPDPPARLERRSYTQLAQYSQHRAYDGYPIKHSESNLPVPLQPEVSTSGYQRYSVQHAPTSFYSAGVSSFMAKDKYKFVSGNLDATISHGQVTVKREDSVRVSSSYDPRRQLPSPSSFVLPVQRASYPPPRPPQPLFVAPQAGTQYPPVLGGQKVAFYGPAQPPAPLRTTSPGQVSQRTKSPESFQPVKKKSTIGWGLAAGGAMVPIIVSPSSPQGLPEAPVSTHSHTLARAKRRSIFSAILGHKKSASLEQHSIETPPTVQNYSTGNTNVRPSPSTTFESSGMPYPSRTTSVSSDTNRYPGNNSYMTEFGMNVSMAQNVDRGPPRTGTPQEQGVNTLWGWT